MTNAAPQSTGEIPGGVATPLDEPPPSSEEKLNSAAVSATQRRPGWSKIIINFWLDLLASLVTFVALWWVSAVLQLLFPAGVAARRWSLWGRSVVDWQNIQFTLLCVLTGGVLLHLMLHWSWLMGVVSTRFLGRRPGPDNGTHTLIGAGLLIALFHIVGITLLFARAAMSRGG